MYSTFTFSADSELKIYILKPQTTVVTETETEKTSRLQPGPQNIGLVANRTLNNS